MHQPHEYPTHAPRFTVVAITRSASLPPFTRGVAMKALSRLASPAGFALVLLLFLFLPFLSVSCEVPGMGSIGADYNGAQLAVGDEPEVEVPAELQDMADELPGGSSESSEPPPDPGVQMFAIIAAIVMLVGIATPLIPRLRTRLFGAAGVAVLAAVLVVVTQVVAQSNLTSQLQEDAANLSDGSDTPGMPDIDTVAEEMIHTKVGFWLTLVGLLLIALISIGVVFKDKLPKPAASGAGTPTPPYGTAAYGGPPPQDTTPYGGPPPHGATPGEASTPPGTGPADTPPSSGSAPTDAPPPHGAAPADGPPPHAGPADGPPPHGAGPATDPPPPGTTT